MEVVIEPQGEIDHGQGSGDDFCATPESGEIMADITVILLDGKGKVLASEDLSFRDTAVKAFLVISYEGATLDPDLVEEFSAGGVVTSAQDLGKHSPSDRIICSPEP